MPSLSKPHFLFPASPLKPRVIDEIFSDQAAALKQAGFGVSAIDIADNCITDEVPEGSTVVYRGWMMTVPDYAFYWAWCLGKGMIPLVDAEQYVAAHYLPNWYPLINTWTSETFIYPGRDMIAWETTTPVGWEKMQVKDYVKSLKTAGGSAINNLTELKSVLGEMEFYRGELEGGICLRKWEDFVPNSEKRYFVINGRYFGQDRAFDVRAMRILANVADRIPSPFWSVDIAERQQDGEFRIVEIGDGQVSDLVGWTPARFADIWEEMT